MLRAHGRGPGCAGRGARGGPPRGDLPQAADLRLPPGLDRVLGDRHQGRHVHDGLRDLPRHALDRWGGRDRIVYLRATTVLTPFVFAEERPRRITAEERATLEGHLEPDQQPRRRTPPLPEEVTSHYPIHVRFSDVDVYGHVNNVKYFEYLQEARISMIRELVPRRRFSVVVAQTDVDYLQPLLFRAEPYDCRSSITRVGARSMTVECGDPRRRPGAGPGEGRGRLLRPGRRPLDRARPRGPRGPAGREPPRLATRFRRSWRPASRCAPRRAAGAGPVAGHADRDLGHAERRAVSAALSPTTSTHATTSRSRGLRPARRSRIQAWSGTWRPGRRARTRPASPPRGRCGVGRCAAGRWPRSAGRCRTARRRTRRRRPRSRPPSRRRSARSGRRRPRPPRRCRSPSGSPATRRAARRAPVEGPPGVLVTAASLRRRRRRLSRPVAVRLPAAVTAALPSVVAVVLVRLGLAGVVAVVLVGLGLAGVVAVVLVGLGLAGVVAVVVVGLGLAGVVAVVLVRLDLAVVVPVVLVRLRLTRRYDGGLCRDVSPGWGLLAGRRGRSVFLGRLVRRLAVERRGDAGQGAGEPGDTRDDQRRWPPTSGSAMRGPLRRLGPRPCSAGRAAPAAPDPARAGAGRS